MYIADIKNEKVFRHREKNEEETPQKQKQSLKTRSTKTLTDSQAFFDTGDDKIAKMMLESELGRMKDKLDDTYFSLAQSQGETKKVQKQVEALNNILEQILLKLKQIAKNDPTIDKMETQRQIFALIDEIAEETKSLVNNGMTSCGKDSSIFENIQKAYVA